MTARPVRLLVAAALLAVLLWRFGPGPFVDGLRSVDLGTVLAVLAIGALTTVAAARRWREVGLGLGLDVPLGAAVASCYRSQVVNTVVPGGVVGDVDRGLRHGRSAGNVPLGLRAVGWDRVAGQTVQIVATGVLLLVLSSRLRPVGAILLVGVVVAAVALLLVARPAEPRSRLAHWWAVAYDDVRRLRGRSLLVVIGLSLVVVSGHAVVMLLSARAAGATDVVALVPVALLVLVAMAVPLHVGGWGIREGAAAWSFAAAGLGAELGVRTAVVYGVVAAVATLPGVLVIAAGTRRAPVREVALDG